MKRLAFLVAGFTLAARLTYAQSEICNDGVDNDGDGFIDCFDSNCSTSVDCDGTFLGNDANCQAQPVEFPKFTMALDFSSPNETTNHLARMAIGDLDRDGVPEIITMNRYTKRVFVLDGRNGSIKHQLNAPFTPQWEIAIGNLDNDNCAEIFTFGTESGNFYLYAYSCDLTTQLWRRGITSDPINFGLADFDGDGKVELYAKDEIYDAKTGVRRVKSNNWGTMNGGPVAVDIRGDDKLELVVGGYIYSVNLGDGTADNGSLTELMKIPNYFIRFEYNATSVADYNQDGFLDVLASGSTGSQGNNTTIFLWDVQNNVVTTYIDPTSDYAPNGWKFGTGRINVADLDGDGQMNASYVSGKYLYALDENLQLFWRKIINEETSGHTGCTLFDFNGDGKSEIVYRDEQFLYIINGTDGSVYNQQDCISRTNREYPIVADVDADGSTEMCVPCGFDDTDAWDNFNDLTYSRYSHIRVFKSAAEPWVPARRLWNQHGYFNVNVRDNLTIPRKQQKHHLVFSAGSCTTGPNRPLNGFLNQSPYLNSLGCPTYASPDLAYVSNSLTVTPPVCPEQDFTISFQITNLGDTPLDGMVPITFYDGDPMQAGALRLNTVNVNLAGFTPGSVSSVTNLTVTGPGTPFTLYISLNDAGTDIPTPISLPNSNFVECDYINNIISSPINPLPVTLVGEKLADNMKCIGSTTPDNGAVRAYVPVGPVQNTTDYNFFWFNGATVDATPDFTGSTYAGIADGVYTVYARHKSIGCSSDTVSVTVGRITGPLIVAITIITPNTDCKNPNGSLKAVANNGAQPPSAFDFAWYEGNDIFTSPQIGVSDVATNLRGLTYTVLVTEKLTGCQTITSATVPDLTAQPVVTTSKVDIVCSTSNSGSVSANVNGGTAGYKFDWYNGSATKPSPDFTGPNYNNLPAGNYTVVATHNASKCISAAVTVTVTQSTSPTVTATKTGDMTSCDPTLPNGSATSSVTGGPAGFTFEWFTGLTTHPSNKIGNASSIASLDVGTYTVKATNNSTGCFDTDQVSITYAVVFPTLSSVVVPVTTCNPYNGNITVTPSMDTPADYTFSWYNGPVVKATPDYPDTDNVLSNLPPGDYTVAAAHAAKHCTTPSITVTVADNSPVISMVLNNFITLFPSDCSSSDGIMGVDISAPGNTLGFKVEWYFGRVPFSAPAIKIENSVPVTSTASGLKTGIYTVIATDLNSGCSRTREFNLPFANAHELLFVSQDDVQTCVPGNDGSATVRLKLPTPPPLFVESEFDIFVYPGTNDPGPSGVANEVLAGVLGQTDYSTSVPQTPGPYTYVAVSKNVATLGCRSVPLLVEIKKATTDPVISVTANMPNTNCTGAPGTGQITVSADGGNPANYTFEWFNGPSTTFPPIAGTGVNGEQLVNLTAGFFTVRATNNTAVSTGCFSVTAIGVGNNPQQVGISGLTVVDPATCDILTGNIINNGSASVTSITENGAPGNLANYTFDWSDAAGAVLQSGASPSLINRAPGTFFVKATNNISRCLMNVEFIIDDGTLGSTTVSLVAFESPERCINPKAGRLTVNGGGTSVSGYNYQWYTGPSPSGTVINNTNDLQGVTVPAGQSSIVHTVKVINNTNSCWAVDTYTVPLIINEVQATVSSSPLTSCIQNDGKVFGTVINDNSLEYAYNWYFGSTVKAAADSLGKQMDFLPAGSYTMVATDIIDSFCASAPQTVIVADARIIPVATAMQTAPVTNCDPAKANGGAAASVGGDVISFVFDWFVGTTVSGAPFFRGAEIGALSQGSYTVRATNRISGCLGTATVAITENLAVIPNPTIVVVSNVTSCVVLNGSLSASVNGVTKDYIFNWYDGGAVQTSVDYTGELLEGLDIGTYTVTATSRVTGCTSGPDTDQIVLQQVYPEFDFKVVPASCDEDNGFASLIMMTNVPIDSIVWIANGSIVEGPNLADVPSGTYQVTVVSQLGCTTTKIVDIGSEIHPFNGVSRNGDGRNDIFNISCIDQFPANNVKIFNRAGTLVYEGDSYDNVEIYFDGQSNKGISPLGTSLPDGTYYYVIDKRNGSKPLAGYLELVR